MSEPTPRIPKVDHPTFPEGYLEPNRDTTLLPWSYVEGRLHAARNYWVVTASAEAQPAVTPVWGVWMDGQLFFDGSPHTRRGRNIQQNPATAVHLESGDQAVILEGQTHILTGAPNRALAERLSGQYTEKYGAAGYSPAPEQWDEGGLFIFEPSKVLAWTEFTKDPTRWQFSKG